MALKLMLVLVILIVATQYETLAAIRLRGWAGMSLLLLSSLGLGGVCGGTDSGVRKALALTTARPAWPGRRSPGCPAPCGSRDCTRPW